MEKERVFGFQKSDMSDVQDASEFVIETHLPLVYDMSRECNRVIDQGSRGICVSVSMNDVVGTACKRMNKEYKRANDYYYNRRNNKRVDGMTVKEAMEMAKSDGDISMYAKIQDLQTLKYSVFTNGACAIALPVYNNDEKFWVGEGSVKIGHCLLVTGWSKDSLILKNSWGTSYGENGYTYFPLDDWNRIYELWTVLK